jgi:hypothetical protein
MTSGEDIMLHRIASPLRRALPLAGLLAGAALVATPAAADHRGGGGGSGHRHGFMGHHHGGDHDFHHGHVVFFGAGVFGGYYGYYYPYAYPYPAYYPPPTYVSRDDCYNTVPRAPGVADLYTCSGQYIGPIAVP